MIVYIYICLTHESGVEGRHTVYCMHCCLSGHICIQVSGIGCMVCLIGLIGCASSARENSSTIRDLGGVCEAIILMRSN